MKINEANMIPLGTDLIGMKNKMTGGTGYNSHPSQGGSSSRGGGPSSGEFAQSYAMELDFELNVLDDKTNNGVWRTVKSLEARYKTFLNVIIKQQIVTYWQILHPIYPFMRNEPDSAYVISPQTGGCIINSLYVSNLISAINYEGVIQG